MIELKKEYENVGFFVKHNFIDEDHVKKIVNEINNLKNNVDFYYDKKGGLRRIERLYNKSEALKLVNNKAMDLLKKVFDTEFVIFKDKFNA